MEVDSATVWTDCLEIIQKQIDEQNFNTWFKPIVPLRHEGDVLTITAPKMQKQIRVKGEELHETLTFVVFVPKDLKIEMPNADAYAAKR